MTQKQDSKGELRAALVTLFMSPLMVAWLMMGTPGLAFVSSLFLVALPC